MLAAELTKWCLTGGSRVRRPGANHCGQARFTISTPTCLFAYASATPIVSLCHDGLARPAWVRPG